VRGELAAFGGDPVPADLDAVRALGGLLAGTAEAAASISRAVEGIAGGVDSSVWSGESADAFRSKLRDLPGLVGKVERSYGDAAEAVRLFLVTAGPVRADAAGLAGRAPSVAAEDDVASRLDPSLPDTAARAAAAAQAVVELREAVAALRADYGRAESVLVDALAVAEAEGIPPDSFWHELVVSVEEWTGVLGEALAVAVAIAAVVLVAACMVWTGAGVLFALGAVLEILGPFFTAMMVLGVAHLAAGVDHKVQYGDDGSAPSWSSLALETAYLVVPFGVGKAFKAARPFSAEGGRLASALDEVGRGAQAAQDAGATVRLPSPRELGKSFQGWRTETGALAGERGAVDFGAPRRKRSNLPAWEKLELDTKHVLSGHQEGGARLAPNNGKTIFENMSDTQIRSAIKQAYNSGKRIRRQEGSDGELRILLEGYGEGRRIRMWVNVTNNTIETAYPYLKNGM
jgi:hypothetical protein